MLSIPPATMQSAAPTWMAWAPRRIAFIPEPQTLFTVVAPTLSGIPA